MFANTLINIIRSPLGYCLQYVTFLYTTQ